MNINEEMSELYKIINAINLTPKVIFEKKSDTGEHETIYCNCFRIDGMPYAPHVVCNIGYKVIDYAGISRPVVMGFITAVRKGTLEMSQHFEEVRNVGEYTDKDFKYSVWIHEQIIEDVSVILPANDIKIVPQEFVSNKNNDLKSDNPFSNLKNKTLNIRRLDDD